jgi:hypothetical protein
MHRYRLTCIISQCVLMNRCAKCLSVFSPCWCVDESKTDKKVPEFCVHHCSGWSPGRACCYCGSKTEFVAKSGYSGISKCDKCGEKAAGTWGYLGKAPCGDFCADCAAILCPKEELVWRECWFEKCVQWGIGEYCAKCCEDLCRED